jgi:hypothetical protein
MRHFLLTTCLVTCAVPAWAGELTLKRVMLSAAGVGYFEYGAPAAPGGKLGLDVPLAQVDDILRSLVVFNAQGGVGSIELPGSGAGAAADQALAQANGADLLDHLRGEEITVTGSQAMTGRIIGTTRDTAPVSSTNAGQWDRTPPTPVRTRVTLLTADGLRQFILEDATAIQPTDPVLRARLAAALDAARTQNTAATRHLTLRIGGDGKTGVNVGYVAAAPLWKASYRVVLPETPGAAARIQGWAVLENQSGEDWHGVDLTLHAGNPVTFHQAIYASYYADRPEVPVQVLGNILPDADSRAVENVRVKAGRRGMPGSSGRPYAPMAMAAPMATMAPPVGIVPGSQEDLIATPATATQAAETAIDTVFHIATPIDLTAGHTASVPIIDQSLPAEQLDLLPVNSDRPVTALRLTNTSPTSLPGGALTLYTGGEASFAGDARLTSLPAGETRLLAFAEDLRTTAHRHDALDSSTIVQAHVKECQLEETYRYHRVFSVDLTAPAHEKRVVLVEFEKSNAHFSVEGGPIAGQSQTSSAWRVPVSLAPGEFRRLTAFADTDSGSAWNLYLGDGTLNETSLTNLLVNGNLTPAATAQVQAVVTLRRTEADREKDLSKLKDQNIATTTDEDRLRDNLKVVTGTDDLHAKLLTALDADESTLSRLRTEIAAAQSALDQAHATTKAAACKMDF